jgi:hypothetical protein
LRRKVCGLGRGCEGLCGAVGVGEGDGLHIPLGLGAQVQGAQGDEDQDECGEDVLHGDKRIIGPVMQHVRALLGQWV